MAKRYMKKKKFQQLVDRYTKMLQNKIQEAKKSNNNKR